MKGLICKGERVLSGFTSPASLAGGVDKHYFNLEHSGKVEVSAAAYFAAMDVVQSQITKEPQGHPHAELMAQYAEDAKTNAEPWRLWEIGDTNGGWWGMTEGSGFVCRLKYRRKPKSKLIHGVEVPDISFVPKDGDEYCHPDTLNSRGYSIEHYSDGCGMTNRMAVLGMCYPQNEEGKQAAILHAKAMLGIK